LAEDEGSRARDGSAVESDVETVTLQITADDSAGEDKPLNQKEPRHVETKTWPPDAFKANLAHEIENELVAVGGAKIKHRRPRQAKEPEHRLVLKHRKRNDLPALFRWNPFSALFSVFLGYVVLNPG